MTDTNDLRPYSDAAAYAFKSAFAAGEWVGGLFLNRFAPRVAGIERGARYVQGGHRLQTADIFKPPGEPPYPVLVWFHGGAHNVGRKRFYDRICKTFAHAGFLVVNADYRMAPRFKFREQWQDAAAAVKWAYDNARWYGGDNSRFFLGGDSAGASLSSAYAVMAQDGDLRKEIGVCDCLPADALTGLLLVYGVYDTETVQETKLPMAGFAITGYVSRDPEEMIRCSEIASPLRHIRPGFPPCFIASSEVDPLHSETLALLPVLDANGAEYRYLELPRGKYPFAQHGYINFWFMPEARLTMREAIAFLEERS